MKNIITNFDNFLIIENCNNQKIWYHGTPDARKIKEFGGFDNTRTKSVTYVVDPILYKEILLKMKQSRDNNDMVEYHKILNGMVNFTKDYVYRTPIFLSDKLSVAKMYSDPKRAFDYQNAEEHLYTIDTSECKKIAKIVAIGDKFRFINIEKVKTGFINSGVSEEEITKLISMFNYYVNGNGMITDVISAIGSWLGFDCIDVIGVLDSYNGGKVESTVRIVLDISKIKII